MKSQLLQPKIIVAAIAVLIMAAAGVWYWRLGGGETGSVEVASVPSGEARPAGSPTSDDFETYRHPSLGFSFQYPKGFKAGSFQDGIGETVVVEVDPVRSQTPVASADAPLAHRTSNGASGFQIYITPFDEEGPLTYERVKKEIPDLVVEGPQTVTLGSRTAASSRSGLDEERPDLIVPALVFFSRNESLGKTREVWFVYPESPYPNGNYLYQVTSYASFDEELSKIMATWKFE